MFVHNYSEDKLLKYVLRDVPCRLAVSRKEFCSLFTDKIHLQKIHLHLVVRFSPLNCAFVVESLVEMVVAAKVRCVVATVVVAAAVVAVRCILAAEAVVAAVAVVAVRCIVAVVAVVAVAAVAAVAAVVVEVRCIVAFAAGGGAVFAVARCVVALDYTHTGFAGMTAGPIAGFVAVSA